MKVNAFEDRSSASVTQSQPKQTDEIISVDASQASASTQPVLDSRQIRRIIREELQGINLNQASQSFDTVEEAPVRDEAELFYRHELVVEEIEMMKQKDEVSSMELEKLMMEIAKLDPETRREKIRELTMAINRGEINGHF